MEANFAISYGFAVMVFIPVFVIAAATLRSATRALALALAFTAGAAAGYVAATASRGLLRSSMGAPPADATFVMFLASAAIAGGVLALFILSRFSKNSLWRRS